VAEWKQATAMLKAGNPEPLKVFVCETLGEPWEERVEESTRDKLAERRVVGVHMGQEWEGARLVFGGADVQQDVIYWTVRAWQAGGHSRLVDAGKVWSFGELQEKVTPLLTHPKFLMIDSGYKTADVYRSCLQYGWKPTKGSEAPYYMVQRTEGMVRQIWRVELIDVAAATKGEVRGKIKLWEFSSGGAKDMLAGYMAGSFGQWELPEDVPLEYINQLLAEQKRERVNKDKLPTGQYYWHRMSRDNHWLDCECQILIGALDSGIVSAS
jgi:phage terminase large subunit GpA-like protein